MICFNGNVIETANPVSIFDRGFQYGDGVFNTLRVIDGVAEDIDLHIDKLNRHATIIFLPNIDKQYLQNSINNFIQNFSQNKIYALKIIYTRGNSVRGLSIPDNVDPNIIMTMTEMIMPPSDPLSVIMSKTTRRNEYSPLSGIKNLNYLDNILAKEEARTLNVDDAIMLNTKGFVTCATSSNIFIREGNNWITPPLEDGVLDGVERLKLIQNGALEESITVERLKNADEIILTNSIWKQQRAVLKL
jgi:branched-chain amino acid aminotransferase